MTSEIIQTDVFDDTIIENDEDTDIYENGSKYPYKMPEEVDIKEQPHTIFEWMRKYERGQLITDPEFQRNLVWKPEQKSKFIESILLNIPLPLFYVNQDLQGKYIIVDGLQRTTTLADFILEKNNNRRFSLEGLEVLEQLNGCFFSDLSRELQTRIEDRKILVYIIRPSVPLPMVYDIFHRINTGGTQLTRQEIRNCLYLGPATKLLKELAQKDYFRLAIDYGISPKRMKDREAVLRYLAFQILDYENQYRDMDTFLADALKKLNRLSENEISLLESNFERVMKKSYEFFGRLNFRLPTNSTRGRINIAVLESVGNFFSKTSDEYLSTNEEQIKNNYRELLINPNFLDAVQFATGDRRRVLARFELAQNILKEVNNA